MKLAERKLVILAVFLAGCATSKPDMQQSVSYLKQYYQCLGWMVTKLSPGKESPQDIADAAMGTCAKYEEAAHSAFMASVAPDMDASRSSYYTMMAMIDAERMKRLKDARKAIIARVQENRQDRKE